MDKPIGPTNSWLVLTLFNVYYLKDDAELTKFYKTPWYLRAFKF